MWILLTIWANYPVSLRAKWSLSLFAALKYHMVSTLWAFIFQNTFLKSLLPLTLLRFSTAVWSISAHVSVLHDSLEWRVSASLYLKRTNKYIYKICYLYGLHKHFKSPLDYLFFSEGNTRVSYLCPDVRESERMKSAAAHCERRIQNGHVWGEIWTFLWVFCV